MDCIHEFWEYIQNSFMNNNYFEMKSAHLVKKNENKDKNDDSAEA